MIRKASLTVEAAFIMPLVIAAVVFIMNMSFFLHDRVILAGLAAETVFWGEHEWQAGGAVSDSTLESAFKTFAGDKLILAENVEFSGSVNGHTAEVRLTADFFDNHSFSVFAGVLSGSRAVLPSECSVWQPERIIREARRIMKIKDGLEE